MLVKFLTQRTV